MSKTIRRRQALVSAPSDVGQNALLARLFASRGALLSESDYRLNSICSPSTLKGIEQAVDLLCDSLALQQNLLIVGDFDADGATSTALVVHCLRAFGLANVDYLLPNRFDFGYGLTPEIVEVAKQRKPDLIVTVDNGIASVAGVSAAQMAGIKVLVTDHHLPPEVLPTADAIINPNQLGCPFPSKNLAGVGVVFYLMIALRSRLRQQGWFTGQGIVEPNMADYLDLVALGTVADVVPLDYNNRILVSQGLRRMREGCCAAGIRALVRVAGRSLSEIVASDLGFAVGPRLNAAGRLDDMSLGVRCLLASSESEAAALAAELDQLNQDRRAIEASMQDEALSLLDALSLELGDALPSGLCLYKPDWHQGVVGILASRIKDKLHRPVIVFAASDDGQLKGSGRSVPGLHLRDILDAVATENPGLLSKFGGHAMAAGLSLKLDDLPLFEHAFDVCVRKQLGDTPLVAEILTDGELKPEWLQLDTAKTLRDAGPWGQGFSEPQFEGQFDILAQRLVGGKHLKLVLAPIVASEQITSDIAIDAIAFNIDLDLWPNTKVQRVCLVYKMDVNTYKGQASLQLIVEHIEALERQDVVSHSLV